MNGSDTVRIKEVLDRTGNTIYLGKGSDSEKSYAHAKESEDLGKPFPLFAHTLFYVIKRASDDMSILCYHTVLHSKQTLRVLGCRTKKGSDPHPQKGSGTACHTDDISGTDRSGKCGTKRCKAGYLSMLTGFLIGSDQTDGMGKLHDLQSLQTDRQKDTCGKNQDDQGNTPYQIIHGR